jgi:hypothetical protein
MAPNKLDKFAHKYNPGRAYYFRLFWSEFQWVLPIPLLFYIAKKFFNKGAVISLEAKKKILLITSATTILFASLVSWKFDRILFQFYPLFIISLFFVIQATKPHTKKISIIVASLALFLSVEKLSHKVVAHRVSLKGRYHVHSAQKEFVYSIGVRKVLVVADEHTYKNPHYVKGFLHFPKLQLIWNEKIKTFSTKNEFYDYFKNFRFHIFIRNDVDPAQQAISELSHFAPIYKNDIYTLYYNKLRLKGKKHWKIPTIEPEIRTQ